MELDTLAWKPNKTLYVGGQLVNTVGALHVEHGMVVEVMVPTFIIGSDPSPKNAPIIWRPN